MAMGIGPLQAIEMEVLAIEVGHVQLQGIGEIAVQARQPGGATGEVNSLHRHVLGIPISK